MKLYTYDHCPFCTRVRVILALTNTKFEHIILLNDDEKTPIKMIGKKMLPILEMDGKFIPESLDIIRLINSRHKILVDKKNPHIETWVEDAHNYIMSLCFPRFIKIDLPEFATKSAIKYFTEKKEVSIKMSFEKALNMTNELKFEAENHIKMLAPLISDRIILKQKEFSESDIILFSTLRMLSVVYGLKWDKAVQDYVRNISAITQIPLHKSC